MISHILRILNYNYRLIMSVCPCVRPFYFKCLFLSNPWPNFDQSCHEEEYWQGLYESWKLQWSVTWSGFYNIKRAVRMCLFSFLSPISQQSSGWFLPCLPGKWALSVLLWILKIKMISHMVRISYNWKKLFGGEGVKRFCCPFLCNRLAHLDQTWQESGYCQWLYKSPKTRWSIT